MMPFFVTTPRDARELLSTPHRVRRTSMQKADALDLGAT